MLLLPLSLLGCPPSRIEIGKGDTGCEEDTANLVEICEDFDADGYGSSDPADCVMVDPCDASGFYVANNSDCAPLDATINPGATEVCDDVDNDCDGGIDEALATTTTYADVDGDGYGDPNAATTDCDTPIGNVSDATDCNDVSAAANPGGIELCNDGLDNDCDGGIDDLTTCVDVDGDGYTADVDCDDNDDRVNPGARESCNEMDDNCDGVVDEDVTTTYYEDADGDGYGVAGSEIEACDQPTGYSPYDTDCDDTDAAYNPGATESDCSDPTDYNCDGSTGYADTDGDGYAACEECDDSSASVYPSAEETCNGSDDDCNGTVDDNATDGTMYYADLDSDGYGDEGNTTTACTAPVGYVSGDSDCDDSDDSVNPSAIEMCDELDNDCDGTVDEDDAADAATWYIDQDGDDYGEEGTTTIACDQPTGYAAVSGDCDDGDSAYNPGADESDCTDPNDYNCDGSSARTDADADGYAACEECDDADADVNPGQTETCNGTDDDCDGDTDEEDAADASTWYADADGDGYGNAFDTIMACTRPGGYTTDSSDCNDRSSVINPGANEECDGGVDENCNGTVDEDSAVDAATWYRDSDNDGHGNPSVTDVDCEQPSGYVADGDDCNDSYNDAYPGNVEWCDGIDNDCTGAADDGDYDGDGYEVCDDCDDESASLNPGEDEVCDDEDNDCDGSVDEDSAVDAATWYADNDSDEHGDPTNSTTSCEEPSGYVADATDCDDSDATVNPNGREIELDSSGVLTDNCGDGIDNDCDGDADSADWQCGDFDSDGNENGIDVFMPYDNDGNGYDDTLLVVSSLVFSEGSATSDAYTQGNEYGGYVSLTSSTLDAYGTVSIDGESVGGLSRDVSGETSGFSSPLRYVVASSSTAACTSWEIMDVTDYCEAQDNGTIDNDEFCYYQTGSTGGACSATLGWTAIVQWNGELYGN